MPLIIPEIEPSLHACVAEATRKIGCNAIEVGGIEDHVHSLVRLSATISVAEAVKQMKGSSSHFGSHSLVPDSFFKWRGTYGAFSVDPTGVDAVIDYIRNQRQHHALGTTRPDWERTDEPDPP